MSASSPGQWRLGGILVVLGYAILVAFYTAGCRRTPNEQIVHILVSGDTSGWITPCGCTSNQSGGMERRGTLLKSIGDGQSRIYLDVGGAGTGGTDYQVTRLKSILQGERRLEIAAHNLGGTEILLTPKQVDELSIETSVVFVSANVAPRMGTSRVVPSVFVEKQGIKVAVTGIVSPKIASGNTSNEWNISDPLQSIVRVFEKSDAEMKIVLAYASESELRTLANSLPEIHLVMGGPTGQMLKPQWVGPTLVSSATNKGKFVAHFTAQKKSTDTNSNGLNVTIQDHPFLEVSSQLARDKDQTDILQNLMETLGKMDVPASQSGLQRDETRNIGSASFVGSESCKGCHSQIHEQWTQSKHAHAWETLVSKGTEVDPACQVCHTTGYAGKGGFERMATSLDRTDVGCESCHGPSSEHNAIPSTKTPWAARGKCQGCHDHENSPQFSMDSYWQKITHGRNTGNAGNDPNNR